MLCGEVARREKVAQALQAECEPLRVRIRALDETMAMFAPNLNPAAAGVVHAFAGKYGKFGGLTAFLLEQIRLAGPSGVDGKSLAERAAVRFTVQFEGRASTKSFKDTVRWSLRYLQDRDQVEVLNDNELRGRQPKVWRAVQGTSFQELLAQQEAIDDSTQNTV